MDSNAGNRLAMRPASKRHGIIRNKRIERKGYAGQYEPAGDPSSRYWRPGSGESGTAAAASGQTLWVGNGGGTYASRIHTLSASLSNVKRGNPAASLRQRPNSSSVYTDTTKNSKSNHAFPTSNIDSPPKTKDLPMPVFKMPDRDNQREDTREITKGNKRSGIRAFPGKSLDHSVSDKNVTRTKQTSSEFVGRTRADSVSLPDKSIEIFEPPHRNRPSSASQVSVSPITIQNMIDNGQTHHTAGGLWGLHQSPQILDSEESKAIDQKSGSLPDVADTASGNIQTGIGLLFRNTGRPQSNNGSKSDNFREGFENNSTVSKGTGLFVSRGTSSLPISSATKLSAENIHSTKLEPPTSDTSVKAELLEQPCLSNNEEEAVEPPKAALNFGLHSPLCKKKGSPSPLKPQIVKRNSLLSSESTKSILKRTNSSSRIKKSVKFNLEENMYSDHVPYVSPPKSSVDPSRATEDIIGNRSRQLGDSMRAPLIKFTSPSGENYNSTSMVLQRMTSGAPSQSGGSGFRNHRDSIIIKGSK